MWFEVIVSKLYHLWGAFFRSHDVQLAIYCRKSTICMEFGNFVANGVFMSLPACPQKLGLISNILIYYVNFHPKS
jgi:hypothetical protein